MSLWAREVTLGCDDCGDAKVTSATLYPYQSSRTGHAPSLGTNKKTR